MWCVCALVCISMLCSGLLYCGFARCVVQCIQPLGSGTPMRAMLPLSPVLCMSAGMYLGCCVLWLLSTVTTGTCRSWPFWVGWLHHGGQSGTPIRGWLVDCAALASCRRIQVAHCDMLPSNCCLVNRVPQGMCVRTCWLPAVLKLWQLPQCAWPWAGAPWPDACVQGYPTMAAVPGIPDILIDAHPPTAGAPLASLPVSTVGWL